MEMFKGHSSVQVGSPPFLKRGLSYVYVSGFLDPYDCMSISYYSRESSHNSLQDAYCNKVPHYKFGSTDITCIFAKNYEKSDTFSFTLTLFSRQCVALQTTESILLMEQLIMLI